MAGDLLVPNPIGESKRFRLFCYALAWELTMDALDRKVYKPAVEKCWIALTNRKRGGRGPAQPIEQIPGKTSTKIVGKCTARPFLAGSEVIKLK